MPYKDKEAAAKAKHESYLRNKEKVRKADRERLVRNRDFVKEYKQREDVVCVNCGMERWECLDFHHIDPSNKKMAINHLVKGRFRIEVILEEIEKCEVLCSNCHRIHHAGNIWLENSNH
jgi:hypothetical protein